MFLILSLKAFAAKAVTATAAVAVAVGGVAVVANEADGTLQPEQAEVLSVEQIDELGIETEAPAALTSAEADGAAGEEVAGDEETDTRGCVACEVDPDLLAACHEARNHGQFVSQVARDGGDVVDAAHSQCGKKDKMEKKDDGDGEIPDGSEDPLVAAATLEEGDGAEKADTDSDTEGSDPDADEGKGRKKGSKPGRGGKKTK